MPGSRTRGQMDPNTPPTAVGTCLTLCGKGSLCRYPTGGGEMWDTKDWIQPTRFHQLNCSISQRTMAFVGLIGECQLVIQPSLAGISKSKTDAPANANPQISCIMRDSTSIKTCRECHKNLSPYHHQFQETKKWIKVCQVPCTHSLDF